MPSIANLPRRGAPFMNSTAATEHDQSVEQSFTESNVSTLPTSRRKRTLIARSSIADFTEDPQVKLRLKLSGKLSDLGSQPTYLSARSSRRGPPKGRPRYSAVQEPTFLDKIDAHLLQPPCGVAPLRKGKTFRSLQHSRDASFSRSYDEEAVAGEDYEGLRRVFDVFDLNCDGEISRSEIVQALHRHGYTVDEGGARDIGSSVIEDIVWAVDESLRGQINFHDFCKWYESIREARQSPILCKSAAIVQAKLFCDLVEFMMRESEEVPMNIRCSDALSIVIDRYGPVGLRLRMEDCQAFDGDGDGFLTFKEFQTFIQVQETKWVDMVLQTEGQLPAGYHDRDRALHGRTSGSDRSSRSAASREGSAATEDSLSFVGGGLGSLGSLGQRKRREVKPDGAPNRVSILSNASSLDEIHTVSEKMDEELF